MFQSLSEPDPAYDIVMTIVLIVCVCIFFAQFLLQAFQVRFVRGERSAELRKFLFSRKNRR